MLFSLVLGCFATLSYNGQAVSAVANSFSTTGYIRKPATDIWVVDPATNEARQLPLVEFEFYQKSIGNQTFLDGSTAAFVNQDRNGYHFAYDGAPLFAPPNPNYTVHVKLDLQSAGNTLWLAHFSRVVDELPSANVNDEYLLESVSCPSGL